jgi:ABC-2 type transport system permease protein
MIGALRYESMRIRTIASSYWLSGIAIVLTAGITMLLALTVDAADIDDVAPAEVTTWVLTAGASFAIMPVLAAAFYAVIGVMAMGHEYRYGTNKATLSALPDRITVLVGKMIVLIVWITATVVATLIVTFLVTSVFFSDPDFSAAARPVFAYWSYSLGFGLAGFGLTAIFRNQTGAMVLVLIWPFVLEPIINGVLFALSQTSEGIGTLTNLLPAAAGRRSMFDPYVDLAGGFGELDTWGLGASFLVFWLGVLVLVVAGSVLFIRRDA